jgi:hypothetical protein
MSVLLEILDDDSESLLALGMMGGNFRSHAVGGLLSIHGCWTEIQSWMLHSALARQDKRTARIYLQDWKSQDRRPTARVSKFIPGEHYHVLDTKFDSFGEAQRYLFARGYTYGGLQESHVYANAGD